jgi:hypothetical protein
MGLRVSELIVQIALHHVGDLGRSVGSETIDHRGKDHRKYSLERPVLAGILAEFPRVQRSLFPPDVERMSEEHPSVECILDRLGDRRLSRSVSGVRGGDHAAS